MYEDLFYKRLAELRANKGVSARDMSLSIGQSAGYINALENRNGFPSMQVFFYICEYLGVTPAEFFEEGNRYPGEYQEILADLKHLDQASLQNVMQSLRDWRIRINRFFNPVLPAGWGLITQTTNC